MASQNLRVTFHPHVVTCVSRSPDPSESLLTRNLHLHRRYCVICRRLHYCERFEVMMRAVKDCLIAGSDGKLYSTAGDMSWNVLVEIPRRYYYTYMMLWLERDGWDT
jgi:hypothetical protein